MFILNSELNLNLSAMISLSTTLRSSAWTAKDLNGVSHLRCEQKSTWLDSQLWKHFKLKHVRHYSLSDLLLSLLKVVFQCDSCQLIVSWFKAMSDESSIIGRISMSCKSTSSVLHELDFNMELHQWILIIIEWLVVNIICSYVQRQT